MSTSSRTVTDLRETVARLPNEPGVYRFLDEAGDVLYVGKAKALRKRVVSYFSKAHDARITEMVARARDVECVVTRSEREALLLEDNFIKESRPPFNLRLRDDKSYPFIEITLTEEWPRVRFTRERHVHGNLYFGPYSSAKKVRETLELIGRIFPYRKCPGQKPGRRSGTPCLQHFINRSLAPCDDRASHEEYMAVIEQVTDFLHGHLREVARHIERDMREAAASQEFEKAALLRDRLEAVRHVQERQAVEHEGGGSFDVVGLYQGEPGGNVQVFRVRDGALVDRQTLFVENAAGRETATVLEEFLLAYYGEGVTIPGQVIADLEKEEALAVAGLLGERRGSKVEVRRAQRGVKRRLWELAQRNAALAAEAENERLQHRRESRELALQELRDALALPALPLRIECYDISNLGEAHPVGSMVVFEGALPKKAHYRKFAIREVPGQDDVAMMREVLLRRFRRRDERDGGGNGDGADREERYDESFARLPDLVVIDGGRGQLSAATAALEERGLELPVVGLAKRREEVFVPGRPSPVELPPDRPACLLLQRIRDEAHRFALTFHRQRRGGALTKTSIFDELPQVGPIRRRRILEHFGSPERFVAASREDLERVPGLPVRVAREIYAQLHKAG